MLSPSFFYAAVLHAGTPGGGVESARIDSALKLLETSEATAVAAKLAEARESGSVAIRSRWLRERVDR